MKKILFYLTLVTIVTSCTNQAGSDIENEQIFETINYTFDGNQIVNKLILDIESDELELVEDESFFLIEKIFNENKNLIQYVIDENNIILLKDDIELDEYLEDLNKPLLSPEEDLSAKFAPYLYNNLELYSDCCFASNSRFDWISPCPAQCQDGLDVERLKDFSNTTMWDKAYAQIAGCGPSSCFNSARYYPGSNPNDKLNSVKVRNVFARFYENSNYSGQTFVLDGRGGKEAYHRKLRKYRNSGRWGNRVSSVQLFN